MSENEDSKEAPKSAKSIIDYIKENITVVVLGFLGVGGTGTGIGFGDIMYQTALTKVVNDLDSIHNIRPLPPHLNDMIIEAAKYKNKTDSNFSNVSNFMSYQMGFNNNIALNDNKVDTICDGIPMQYNTLNETFHVEWDGYVYTATKVGKETWAIYLFQWQLDYGQNNYFEIDPLYYKLR